MLNHAGFSFSSLQCIFGSCICVMSLPLNRFPYSSNIPLFFHSFFFSCVYTQECESKDTLQGRGKGFSLSDPSLPFIPLLNHFWLLLSLPASLLPPFPGTYSFSLNLYWLYIGQLLQVHWNCKRRKALLR